jgi:hypothetical protein
MMLRLVSLLALVVCLTFSVFAEQKPDLRTRADQSSGGDKAKYAAEYTEQATKEADKAFADGNDSDGTARLQDVATYGKMAADASMTAHKREKNTEIALRKVLKHLNDIKNARPFEEQSQVQKVIDTIQAAHDSLLDFMFQKGH